MTDQSYQPSLQRQTERERGARAWNNIEEVCQQSDEVKKKYRTQARQFAALVRTNGLAQTVAFLYAKGDWAENEDKLSPEARSVRYLLEHLDAALFKKEDEPFQQDRLIRYLLESSGQANREATVAALAFTRWLSRFAEAQLPSEAEERKAGSVRQEDKDA